MTCSQRGGHDTKQDRCSARDDKLNDCNRERHLTPQLWVVEESNMNIEPALRPRVTHKKRGRLVKCDALFHVVGMYEISARVAKIMITEDTAPPSAVADH